MRMPWGKYAGELLDDIPLSYLAFALESWNLEPRLRIAIAAAVRRRVRMLCGHCDGDALDVCRLREAIERCRVALAVKYHPDRHGGDHTLMRVVNEFAATVLEDMSYVE